MDDAVLKHALRRASTMARWIRSVYIKGYQDGHKAALGNFETPFSALELVDAFLFDGADVDPDSTIACCVLHDHFCSWCKKNHPDSSLGPRLFVRAVKEVGISIRHTRNGTVFVGLRLRDANDAMRGGQ